MTSVASFSCDVTDDVITVSLLDSAATAVDVELTASDDVNDDVTEAGWALDVSMVTVDEAVCVEMVVVWMCCS